MAAPPYIVGAILAGGQSRRFGGGDKGLADLDGQPVLARVIACFSSQVSRLVLNANGDPARFGRFGQEIVWDGEHAGLGPLSGLLASLSWMRIHAPDAAALATVTSDTPFLPGDLVARLDAARGNDAAIATSAGRRHPTIALWPLSIRDEVAEALAGGHLGVDRFAARIGAVEVAFPMRDIGGRSVDPFFNVNTPDDLALARRLLTDR